MSAFSKSLQTVSLVVVTVATSFADTMVVGNSTGELFTRGEFNVGGANISYVNFGWAIGALDDRSSDRVLAIGLNQGGVFQGNIRGADNLPADLPNGEFGSGAAMLSVAVRPDGHIAFGTSDGAIYMQNSTNLLTEATGYTGAFNGVPIFATALNGMDIFPDGDLLIGGQTGEVWVRDRNDISQVSSNLAEFGEAFLNFGAGEPIAAVAVSPSGNMIIGRGNGGISTRSPSDPGVDISTANFGTNAPIKSIDVLSNGNVVIGLGDGTVDIRNESNLTASVDSAVLGASVDAVKVTSNDNIWMGTAANLVFARSGTNLNTEIGGTDGLNFNAPITAIAAFTVLPAVTEPMFESITRGTSQDTVVLQWSSEAGRGYTLEGDTSLGGGGGYSVVSNGIPATAPSNVFTADTLTANGAYRVISNPE